MFNLRPRGYSLFDDVWNMLDTPRANLMKTDIKENDDHYLFLVDLPGISKEDIKISVENNYLKISVSTNKESEDKGDGFIRKERSTGSFLRKYYVGNIKTEDLSASYKDGVLSLVIPKINKESEIKYLDIE